MGKEIGREEEKIKGEGFEQIRKPIRETLLLLTVLLT